MHGLSTCVIAMYYDHRGESEGEENKKEEGELMDCSCNTVKGVAKTG